MAFFSPFFFSLESCLWKGSNRPFGRVIFLFLAQSVLQKLWNKLCHPFINICPQKSLHISLALITLVIHRVTGCGTECFHYSRGEVGSFMWFPFNEQWTERKFSHAPADKLDHSRLAGLCFFFPSMLYCMYLFPGGSDHAQRLIGSVDCFTACVWCWPALVGSKFFSGFKKSILGERDGLWLRTGHWLRLCTVPWSGCAWIASLSYASVSSPILEQ